MENQELNKKLAKWAGFKTGETPDIDGYYLFCGYEDKTICCQANFTDSLDACFKWLVPKACLGWIKFHPLGGECHITANGKGYIGLAGNPPLALCRAIIKLMEKDIDNTGGN